MNKKQLSETDICEKFISPALTRAGWTIHDQVYRELPPRAGRVMVRGSKSRRDEQSVLRADYALFFKANIPIAAVEAKDNNLDLLPFGWLAGRGQVTTAFKKPCDR